MRLSKKMVRALLTILLTVGSFFVIVNESLAYLSIQENPNNRRTISAYGRDFIEHNFLRYKVYIDVDSKVDAADIKKDVDKVIVELCKNRPILCSSPDGFNIFIRKPRITKYKDKEKLAQANSEEKTIEITDNVLTSLRHEVCHILNATSCKKFVNLTTPVPILTEGLAMYLSESESRKEERFLKLREARKKIIELQDQLQKIIKEEPSFLGKTPEWGFVDPREEFSLYRLLSIKENVFPSNLGIEDYYSAYLSFVTFIFDEKKIGDEEFIKLGNDFSAINSIKDKSGRNRKIDSILDKYFHKNAPQLQKEWEKWENQLLKKKFGKAAILNIFQSDDQTTAAKRQRLIAQHQQRTNDFLQSFIKEKEKNYKAKTSGDITFYSFKKLLNKDIQELFSFTEKELAICRSDYQCVGNKPVRIIIMENFQNSTAQKLDFGDDPRGQPIACALPGTNVVVINYDQFKNSGKMYMSGVELDWQSILRHELGHEVQHEILCESSPNNFVIMPTAISEGLAVTRQRGLPSLIFLSAVNGRNPNGPIVPLIPVFLSEFFSNNEEFILYYPQFGSIASFLMDKGFSEKELTQLGGKIYNLYIQGKSPKEIEKFVSGELKKRGISEGRVGLEEWRRWEVKQINKNPKEWQQFKINFEKQIEAELKNLSLQEQEAAREITKRLKSSIIKMEKEAQSY